MVVLIVINGSAVVSKLFMGAGGGAGGGTFRVWVKGEATEGGGGRGGTAAGAGCGAAAGAGVEMVAGDSVG